MKSVSPESNSAPRFQIVVCHGPRCRARGQVARHVAQLESRITEDAHGGRITVGSYECLSRCPAGPSVLVRELPECEGPVDPAPGMLDLDGGSHYHAVTGELLDRIVDEHCHGKPIAGRFQRY